MRDVEQRRTNKLGTRSLNSAYARLLKYGLAAGPDYGDLDVPEPERSRWLREVAEPWWREMEARAERDDLRVKRYLATDSLYESRGHEPLVTAVELVGPHGRSYGWQIQDYETQGERMERAERDWGDTLTVARERAGIQVRAVRRHRRSR